MAGLPYEQRKETSRAALHWRLQLEDSASDYEGRRRRGLVYLCWELPHEQRRSSEGKGRQRASMADGMLRWRRVEELGATTADAGFNRVAETLTPGDRGGGRREAAERQVQPVMALGRHGSAAAGTCRGGGGSYGESWAAPQGMRWRGDRSRGPPCAEWHATPVVTTLNGALRCQWFKALVKDTLL